MVVLHLRVVEELGAVTEALAPHVGVVVEDLLPLRERLLTGCLDHQLPHRRAFVGVLELGYLAPLRVVEHPVEPEGAQEGAEEARRRLRELHPVAVGRQEHGEPEVETGRGDATRVERGSGREGARVALRQQHDEPVPRVVRGETLNERGVDALTPPAPLALVQRGEHTL